MVATMASPPPAREPLSNRQVDTIRGQHHKFMLIPLIEDHTRWFDAGPISIVAESHDEGGSPGWIGTADVVAIGPFRRRRLSSSAPCPTIP